MVNETQRYVSGGVRSNAAVSADGKKSSERALHREQRGMDQIPGMQLLPSKTWAM